MRFVPVLVLAPTPAYRLVVACAAFAALGVFPARARAQSCTSPTGIRDFFPADGSHGNPLNAIVRVRYSDASAQTLPLDARIRLYLASVEVPGTIGYDDVANEAIFVPGALLQSSSAGAVRYDVVAAGPYGDQGFAFYTGAAIDEAPPVFAGVGNVVARRHEGGNFMVPGSCATASGDGFVLSASFDPAADASGAANVEYIAYQTLGAGVSAPVERARVRGFAGALQLAFFVPIEEGDQPVCVNVQAVDMFGRADGNVTQSCVRPEVSAHFRGLCAASGRTAGGDLSALGLLALVALGLAGRRVRNRSVA